MSQPLSQQLSHVWALVLDYLPALISGLALLVVGWLLGWLAKRIAIRLCVALRVERMLGGFRWGKAFAKADVRHALFGAIGNIVFLVVFLIFADSALASLKMSLLSSILARGVTFIPRLIIGLLIVGVGWIVSARVALAIESGLKKEGVGRATLVARFSKVALLLFAVAMALIEIDVARILVLIGFTVAIVTLAMVGLLITWIGRNELMRGHPGASEQLPPEDEG